MEGLVAVGVAEIEQVERAVVVVECRVWGKLEEVLDTVVWLKWRWSGPYWSPSNGGCCSKSERAKCGRCGAVSESAPGFVGA